ncbi:Opioid-binding protein/cell adhesion molecule [Orchesella cincta]|uniref:Opioid-binding protein/cell adhesion molecule n=1 Tax=Orchesella cincta TaxID=48709 RepID=A0A1D2MEI2_ORCCI|nr:Opioid-binding protein/cell adhesion molecule [Orchesella cincta]
MTGVNGMVHGRDEMRKRGCPLPKFVLPVSRFMVVHRVEQVSWLKRKKDSLQLLTVGNTTYNSDSRLGLRFRYPNNWRLGIESVNKGDEGEYQCQLSTHPPKALVYHVKVIAPAVVILDENGHTVTERHYKVDSSLHLTCRASHIDKLVENVVWLKGDRVLPGGDSRIKVKLTKNQTSGEATAYLSVLSVRKGDSGNYTCRASQATSTIAVHVLNGELPAAVQHESSANRLAVASSQLATTVLMLISAAATSSSLINVVMFPTSYHNGHPSLVLILGLSLTLLALARWLFLIISEAKLMLA